MDSTRVNGKNCITFVNYSNQREYVGVYKENGCFLMVF